MGNTICSTSDVATDAIRNNEKSTQSQKFDVDQKEEPLQNKLNNVLDVGDKKEVEAESEYMSESEKLNNSEVESEEIEEDFDDELFSKEMDLALSNVRKLAAKDQEEFVNKICAVFEIINGSEPSINEISDIFSKIKKEFAEEAMEEDNDNDTNSEYDDEEDSDFDPNDIEELEQAQNDQNEDYFLSESENEELSENSDSDYDPNDAEDIQQVQEDQDEDIYDSESEENRNWVFGEEDQNEKDRNWVFGADEESIINSESFDSEYFAAIECARNQAVIDKDNMLENIMEELEITKDQVLEALNNFVETEDESEINEEAENEELSQNEEEQIIEVEAESEQESEIEIDAEVEGENEEEVDSEVFSNEMDLALSNVRELAAKHQQEFVEHICAKYRMLNGVEPSINEILSIFDEIKADFAEEAREAFLEDVDEDSLDEQDEEEQSEGSDDSDYDPKDESDETEDYSEQESEQSDSVQDIE